MNDLQEIAEFCELTQRQSVIFESKIVFSAEKSAFFINKRTTFKKSHVLQTLNLRYFIF